MPARSAVGGCWPRPPRALSRAVLADALVDHVVAVRSPVARECSSRSRASAASRAVRGSSWSEQDVLVVGMRPAADRTEPVQRRHPDTGGEVAVRGSADGASAVSSPEAVRRPSSRARSNSAAPDVGSIGGRFGSPMHVSRAPGTVGVSASIAACTRPVRTCVPARTSMSRWAPAGTVLVVVPAAATVGVTVVPSSADTHDGGRQDHVGQFDGRR